jgi:hypothetical protein
MTNELTLGNNHEDIIGFDQSSESYLFLIISLVIVTVLILAIFLAFNIYIRKKRRFLLSIIRKKSS